MCVSTTAGETIATSRGQLEDNHGIVSVFEISRGLEAKARESEGDARQMRTVKFQGTNSIKLSVMDGILRRSYLSGHVASRSFGMGCIVSEAPIINGLIKPQEGLQIDDVSNEE